MSEFCDKYGLKETQMTAMIKDGWISISIPFYDRVVIHYKESKSYQKTADAHNISKSEVAYIVKRYKTI